MTYVIRLSIELYLCKPNNIIAAYCTGMKFCSIKHMKLHCFRVNHYSIMTGILKLTKEEIFEFGYVL